MRNYIFTLGIVLAGLFTQAGAAVASQYQVAPVQVMLAPGQSTALLSVRNQAPDPLRFQVTASAWDQSAEGELLLSATGDIQLFPRLLTIPPGGEAKIRISSRAVTGQTEQSYRVFIEELPPLETPDQDTGAKLRVLTKTGIPVFVAPREPFTRGTINEISARDGVLRFAVQNEGNAHFSVRSVRVRLLGTDGATLAENTLNGWYVLAGGRRDYAIALPDDVCSQLGSVELIGDTSAGELLGGEPTISCTSADGS